MVHVSVLCFIAELYDRGWRLMRRFQRRKERKTAEGCYDRTVFATRHEEGIMNLIETSFNASQTLRQTLRPTYMDKNGTWKTVVLFLSKAPLHYILVRVLCFYNAFSVACRDGHVCLAVCQFQIKNTRADFDEVLCVRCDTEGHIKFVTLRSVRPYAWNNSREPLNRLLWNLTSETYTNYCRVSSIFIHVG
jgi:hypothetical protein